MRAEMEKPWGAVLTGRSQYMTKSNDQGAGAVHNGQAKATCANYVLGAFTLAATRGLSGCKSNTDGKKGSGYYSV